MLAKKEQYNVAVAGATGAVGRKMFEILAERDFPVANLKALASARSVGQTLDFKGSSIVVEELTESSFDGVDIALFSAGASVSRKFAPFAVKSSCIVIDNSSAFRMEPNIPLVVPEVNPDAIGSEPGIIANPNCSTIQMVVALKPLHDAVGLRRVTVSTYQAVSGAGKRAIEELAGQTAALLNGQSAKPGVHSKQIAFNALPAIGPLQANGYTHEEMKMVWETQKILEDKTIEINPTAVRIPVFYGHCEAVYVETRAPIKIGRAHV
jgi:aspartate-semialdehyde dehydrogenase